MQCPKCKAEQPAQQDRCSQCGYQDVPVQVLTPNERENFQGMTIQDEEPRQNPRIYVRQVHIGSSGLTGLLLKLFLLAAVLIVVFVFLPMALLLLAAGALGWFILKLLTR